MREAARVTRERWTAVDRWYDQLLTPADPALAAALEAPGLPAIHVSPNQGKFLHLLARACRAERVLEVGTLAGYSAIWLARALPPGGRLVTLELDPHHARVARANLAAAGLDGVAEVVEGPAHESLAKLDEAEPFDLVFVDADKQSYPAYLRQALRLTRPGGVIVADNVVRDGAVVDPDSRDEMVLGVRRFAELVAAEPRLAATVVQTVGEKGYDGFLLAYVLPA